MTLSKCLKVLISRVFHHCPLTSSQAIYSKFSSAASSERQVINIFKNSKPSVVTINSDFDIIENGVQKCMSSEGTGVVWDTKGHIVTNYHVVRDAVLPPSSLHSVSNVYIDVYIVTSDGVENLYDGKIVGANRSEDLAVLKITAPKELLKPIKVGKSTILEVGQKCFAIGASNSFRHSFTAGVISCLNVDVDNGIFVKKGMIQNDAFTSIGASGGPLLNYHGHMIGLNTLGYSEGVAFAIQSATVIKIITHLIKYNNAKCPGLNITIESDFLFHEINTRTRGALVTHVAPLSCAAGFLRTNLDMLIKHDIIVAVGDKTVENKGDLFETLGEYRAGDMIHLKVKRDNLDIKLFISFEDY